LTFRLFIFHGQVPSLAPVRKIEATPECWSAEVLEYCAKSQTASAAEDWGCEQGASSPTTNIMGPWSRRKRLKQ